MICFPGPLWPEWLLCFSSWIHLRDFFLIYCSFIFRLFHCPLLSGGFCISSWNSLILFSYAVTLMLRPSSEIFILPTKLISFAISTYSFLTSLSIPPVFYCLSIPLFLWHILKKTGIYKYDLIFKGHLKWLPNFTVSK